MPVNPMDRPISALREDTIDQLILNYSHGELSLESFERRLDQAMDAETHDALLSLTSDLDLVVDSTFKERKRREFNIITDPHGAMGEDRILSVFGNTDRKGAWDVSNDIQIISLFGNTVLDFNEARFHSMTTHINVSCIFGNVNLFISEGFNVVSKVSCIFGGVKEKAPYSHDADVPTIILEGFVLFGDIKIKMKKTFRERLLRFAETLRGVFEPPAKQLN